jgi:hypothetical protein
MKNLPLYIIAILILLLLLTQYNGCQQRKQLLSTVQSSQDSITRFYEGQTKVAQIANIEASRKDLAALQNHNDSIIRDLAKDIRRMRGRIKDVSRFISEFEIDTVSNTIVIRDSSSKVVRTDSTIVIYPRYEAEFEDTWIKYKVIAGYDSTNLKLKIKEDFTVSHKTVGKWYQKKKDVFEVKSLNPYTEVKAMRSITVPKKSTRLGLGIYGGVGVDSDLSIRPQVGVGLYYNLIPIR